MQREIKAKNKMCPSFPQWLWPILHPVGGLTFQNTFLICLLIWFKVRLRLMSHRTLSPAHLSYLGSR